MADHIHYMAKCKHGLVQYQCRCASADTRVDLVECDQWCQADSPDADKVLDYDITAGVETIRVALEQVRGIEHPEHVREVLLAAQALADSDGETENDCRYRLFDAVASLGRIEP